jgi:tetratricopeptide (TPR) repeat protein
MNKSAKKSPKKVKTASSPKADTLVLNEPFFSTKRLFWIVGLVAFLVFANSISNGYNLDDELVTQNHPLTSRGLEAIGDIFTSPYYSDEMGYAYGYRPMVHLSFAIEHQFFGEKASVSHFFNVILFALSAMLFFKFLLKLAGEKQLLFSLLATLLFVVHPIHTEVVDSIKNRDEILAFLFVILSGTSILKFSKYGNPKSLIFVFIYFTCAMLSKKSVFPMVFVIPLLLVLSSDLTLRKLLLILVLLIFPGATVAGELDLFKTLIFAILPFVVIFPLYYLKIKLLTLSDFSSKITFIKQLFPFLVAVLTAFFAVYFNQFYWTIISLLFGVWALKADTKWGVFLLTFLLVGFDWRFQSNHFALMAIFISTSYSFSIYFRTKKLDFEVLFFLFSIFYFLVICHTLLEFGFVINIVLFCFLLFWRAVYSLVFSLLVLVVWAVFFKLEGFLPFAFLVASLAYFVHKFYPKINFYALQLLFFIAIITGQSSVSNQLFTKVSPQEKSMSLSAFSKEYNNVQLQSIVPKEGRFLEYIENTLVAPHSTAETIGTGAQTLGEYLKLMVFPYELSFYYGYSKTVTVGLKNPWVWVSIISHLLLVFLALLQIKKRPFITIGIVWYFLSILLFSNWTELVAGMVGERLAFTASAGFCIFIAALIFWIRPSFSFKKPSWIEFVVVAVVILFLVKTVSRNTQWKNHITLMENDLTHLSNSAQANNLFASNLMKYAANDASLSDEERFEFQKLAAQHFKKSVQIYPYFFNTQFDKARASASIGDTISAINGYKKAIQLDSTFSDSYFYLLNIFRLQKDQKSYLKTARLLGYNFHSFSIQSEQQKAIEILKDTSNVIASFNKEKLVVKSIEDNPLNAEAYFDLLNVYDQQNNGLAYLSTAKKLAKIYNKSDLYEALAKGYFMTNKIDSAITILNQGISLFPQVQSLKDNLKEVEKFR